MDAEAEIASSTRQIHHKLRLVAALDAKGRIAAIQGSIEKFCSILDHEIASIGTIPDGSSYLTGQIWMNTGGR